ncbi:MAG: hypothetical protein LKJ47_05810 [Bifidobacteriaceae bacterium]|jgi:hypothetical protein|nr:hypothetical protein [Bifidobacteriaceae bacterium]
MPIVIAIVAIIVIVAAWSFIASLLPWVIGIAVVGGVIWFIFSAWSSSKEEKAAQEKMAQDAQNRVKSRSAAIWEEWERYLEDPSHHENAPLPGASGETADIIKPPVREELKYVFAHAALRSGEITLRSLGVGAAASQQEQDAALIAFGSDAVNYSGGAFSWLKVTRDDARAAAQYMLQHEAN